MTHPKHATMGPETSRDERAHRRLQVLYVRKLMERQTYMQELKDYRKRCGDAMFNTLKRNIGPYWYQALSVPQRRALDSLAFSIYQDLLEGRPIRTAQIMQNLGLCPRPNTTDLMNCVYLGRNDPKEMLAQLFLMTYGHPIDGKQMSYSLNGRLMLSGIYYLGLANLICLLRERFQPDKSAKKPAIKPKPPKEPPLASPYLQNMIAALYEPSRPKRKRPPPLPNLDELNEPYEEDPPIPKPPPLPPPPPPPKKRLPRSYCDKVAGVYPIEAHHSGLALTGKASHRSLSSRKLRTSKYNFGLEKAVASGGARQKKGYGRRPTAPTTGLANAQYVINGVFKINGKNVFVLGTVSILRAEGELIHGGHKYLSGEYINIHCGFRGKQPPPKPDPCDCIKAWQDTAFKYVKGTKCKCGHHFDYGNKGQFPPEELNFFQKPTRHTPYHLNYQDIFDVDNKQVWVKREFKRVWETDSMLVTDQSKDKKDSKKKKKRSSQTCLGDNPTPEDYLKCALRLMRRINIAARLPDIYLAPELKEWMRRRIHGPYKQVDKSNMLRDSTTYWQFMGTLAGHGYGHVFPPRDPTYAGHTTWTHKHNLNTKFKKYTQHYKLATFRAQAEINNLFWTTMCQAAFPDRNFREIYFSYLYSRMEDVKLLHPYNTRESIERMLNMKKRRYCCPPDGIEPKD